MKDNKSCTPTYKPNDVNQGTIDDDSEEEMDQNGPGEHNLGQEQPEQPLQLHDDQPDLEVNQLENVPGDQQNNVAPIQPDNNNQALARIKRSKCSR